MIHVFISFIKLLAIYGYIEYMEQVGEYPFKNSFKFEMAVSNFQTNLFQFEFEMQSV